MAAANEMAVANEETAVANEETVTAEQAGLEKQAAARAALVQQAMEAADPAPGRESHSLRSLCLLCTHSILSLAARRRKIHPTPIQACQRIRSYRCNLAAWAAGVAVGLVSEEVAASMETAAVG